jgi:multicomponent Na+:H+ antiporter subunit D
MAIAQKELKRMLAYSSIAQIGYIGLGIGLANPLGYTGAFLHLLNHAIMKACLFLVAGHLRIRTGTTELSAFQGAGRRQFPWTTAAFTLAALSMVGIPPLAGFFGKWYLALGAIQGGRWGHLAVILLGSLLTAVYFFRALEIFYLAPPTPAGETGKTAHGNDGAPGKAEGYEILVPVLTLAACLILLGILNASVVAAIRKMLPPGME